MTGLRGFLIAVCVTGCGDQLHPDTIDAGDRDHGSDAGRDAGAEDAGMDAGGGDTEIVCASGNGADWSIDANCYDGLHAQTLAVLTDPCTINTGTTTMTLSARGDETAYLTLRAADGLVIANAQTAGGSECAVPTTYRIAIAEDPAHTGVEHVFLDYLNGMFSPGSTTAGVATAGVTLALGAGSSLVVRGSGDADKMYAGSTYASNVLAHSWLNANGDTSPDVRFDGVTDVQVTTGPGADVISADGGNGTTGVALDASISFSAYGGRDNDTLTGGKGPSRLDGGDGNDIFLQTQTIGPDTIIGGKGVDTVDYSVRTAAVTATVCTTCEADPSNCVTNDLACHDTADGAFAMCNLNASMAQTMCHNTASNALTMCNNTAISNRDTCRSACIPGDTTCTDPCDMTYTSDQQTCTDANTSAEATCSSNFNSASATCANNQSIAYVSCDTTAATCQANTTVAACAVCVGDDGATSEGDTINDDVETVLGGKGNDLLSVRWAKCSDGAATPTLKCTLKGNDGDDMLIGSPFADLLDGGNGNDLIQPRLGDDTIIGGAGTDTVTYAERTNTVKVSLDAAHLWVAGQNGEAGENDSIAPDVENLSGGSGDDFLRGSSGANIMRGGPGNDTMEGGLGNDSLYGDAGNDLLYGGPGNDMLVAGTGVDTLFGGDGDDFLDATDQPGAADLVIDCDGVNDSAGTSGTDPGTSDALVKDSADTGAQHCEL